MKTLFFLIVILIMQDGTVNQSIRLTDGFEDCREQVFHNQFSAQTSDEVQEYFATCISTTYVNGNPA